MKVTSKIIMAAKCYFENNKRNFVVLFSMNAKTGDLCAEVRDCATNIVLSDGVADAYFAGLFRAKNPHLFA